MKLKPDAPRMTDAFGVEMERMEQIIDLGLSMSNPNDSYWQVINNQISVCATEEEEMLLMFMLGGRHFQMMNRRKIGLDQCNN